MPTTRTAPTVTIADRNGVPVVTCSACPAWWGCGTTDRAASSVRDAHLDDHARWADEEDRA